MSSIVAQFDPSVSNTAQFTAPQGSANGALVFFNESQNSITLTFADGSNMYLPAWYHRHKCGATGSVNVQWDIHTVLSSGSPPMSLIIVEAFAGNERFPADGPLVRQTNGDVNSTVTATNAISNTGNPPGTNWLTVQPTDAGSATFTAGNEGNLTIKGNNAGVLTTLLQLIAGASPAVKLAAAGIIAEVLGGLKVDGTFESVGVATFDANILANGGMNITTIRDDVVGSPQIALSNTSPQVTVNNNLKVVGTSSLDNGNIVTDGVGNVTLSNNVALKWKDTLGAAQSILYLDGSNNTILQMGNSSANLYLQDESRNVIAQMQPGIGFTPIAGLGGLAVQKVFFNIGAIKDLNKGSISASGTVNHGLTGNPTNVLMCPSSGSSTWTFGASGFTSTQFTATINSALNTNWTAYR